MATSPSTDELIRLLQQNTPAAIAAGKLAYAAFGEIRGDVVRLRNELSALATLDEMRAAVADCDDAAGELAELRGQLAILQHSIERATNETRRLAAEAGRMVQARNRFVISEATAFRAHGGVMAAVLADLISEKGLAVTADGVLTET